MDYKKFVYEQKKRDKILKAKSTQVTVKEIRFGPQTDEHDYEFKRKNAEKFLNVIMRYNDLLASVRLPENG